MNSARTTLDQAIIENDASYFSCVVESSPDCVRILDLCGRVEFMNERGQRLFEIEDFAANRGGYWPDLWPQAARAAVEAAVEAARGGETHRFRAYCPTATGFPRWWDTVVSPVYDKGCAAPVRLLATSRDVTAELDLRACLDSIVESVPVALMVKDAADGRLLLINRAAEDLVGRPRAEMVGKTEFECFPAEFVERWRRSDVEAITTGRTHVEEETITLDSGERHFYRSMKVATPANEGPQRVIVVCEDITSQVAAADALRSALEVSKDASRLKSEFLANMSHEIRTPLNGVLAVADLLARTTLDAEQREMVGLVQRSGGALQRLLNDVLDLARLDAGRLELEARAFDVTALAAAAGDRAARAAAAKGLAFELNIQAPSWIVGGDPVRLTQILDHILSNAVRFTKAGHVRLSVSGHREGGVARMRFEVRDTGPGFDESQKDRLFRRFEQADGSLSRAHQGSGLGLPLSSALAQLMGGVLDATSRPGEGSLFTLELPLDLCEGERTPDRRDDEGCTAEGSGATSLRVLLAEDHPINQRVVQLMLAPADVDLTCVDNGQEAVETLERQDFDLVLMDMQMPVMDGLTATRLIRERERRTGARRTPIISVTANILPEHVRASREAGADLHLPKPLSVAGLFQAIEAVLTSTVEVGADQACRVA
ncbi:MAG: PAS domain-containing protein [Phenylobacterium sp.]|uniref:PAS domain-containing sensor histidine kinase n=1 Tax=Phenylobacterium sp. TaxID=1871053 RepID=UPI0027327D4D|nr:PAS domain-containing sensor histidine kinase [Phenylobacterium sp.]MDP3749940.1 PAS domain-containing protein [Phenylobacterium sp.]